MRSLIEHTKETYEDAKTDPDHPIQTFVILFLPAPIVRFYYNMKNPVNYYRRWKDWNSRPKKIGAKVFYHGEGPFEVIRFTEEYPKEDDAFYIIKDGVEIRVNWECCSPVE